MHLFRRNVPTKPEQRLLARFWSAAFQAWRQETRRIVTLAAFLVLVVLLQLFVQVLLNMWNRNFFDALGRRQSHVLFIQAELFLPLATASILLAAASVWGRMSAQRLWREVLTRHVLARWLEKDRFRQLTDLVKGSENPEYRIAVDARLATDAPIDMAVALFTSLLTSITFFGVLWTVGGDITFVVLDTKITVPGYLVIGVIVYSGSISGLMLLFGRHLTSVSERMSQTEAEFRAAIDAVRGQNGNLASAAGFTEMRQALQIKLQAVLLWWREYCWQLVRTTLVSQGSVLLAPVVGWLLCVPKYLAGAMSLGELTQSAAAFVVVQSAFNWLVDNYQRVADWESAAHRVATLLLALDDLEAKDPRP